MDPDGAAHLAAFEGNLEKLKKLTECGYRLDRQDEFGETPLMECIKYGHRHIASYLIDKVSPDSLQLCSRYKRWNALHFMAYRGYPWRDIWFRIVKKAPQCLNQMNAKNQTPEQLLKTLATKSEIHKTLNNLLKDDAVHIASVQGDLDILKKLYVYKTRLDEADAFGETPLMESIMYGHQHVAGFLIDKVSPASLMVRNLKNNWNALHLMAKYGRPWRGILHKILHNAPECSDQKDSDGQTPRQVLEQLSTKTEGHIALSNIWHEYELTSRVNNLVTTGNLIELKKLHSDGWSLGTPNMFGQTSLMLAIEYERENIAMFLANIITENALVTDDNLNNNALHYIARYGRPWNDVWRFILQECPRLLNKKNAHMMTPVDLVIKNRDKDIGHRSLYENVITKGAAHAAAIQGNLDKLTELIKCGYRVDRQDECGETPLMECIKNGHRHIALYLIDNVARASLRLCNHKKRWNVLHIMAYHMRPWREVWFSIAQKAPQCLKQTDAENQTPEQLLKTLASKSEKHKPLKNMLKDDMPSFIETLDDDTILKFVCGLDEHAEETRNIKVMFIGHEMVGKTCLVKQLFGEYIDLQTLISTNVAELHLRRLLLDMLTLERISGTSAEDIVLERLRMVISKIKEDEHVIETEERLTEESDMVEVPLLPVCNQGTSVAEFVEFTESQDADTIEPQAALLPNEDELEKFPTKTESFNTNLTEQQKKVIDLVLHQGADSRYETKAFVTMYDFGGEEVFYNTHHSLMTSDSIYLLVFDVAMCLSKKDEQEGLDSIVKWLQSVATYAVDTNESRKGTPPVLMIGSHMDLVEETEDLQIFLEKLRSVPGIKEILDAHLKGFFPIANLNDSNKNADIFLKIWKTIAEVAPLQSQWKKLIPGKWIALEFELLQKKESGVKVMTIEELMELNKRLTLPLENVKSLKLFLRYLHMTGFMLCFDLESENPIIVLNAQWVIDAFKCLITAIKFVTGLTTSEKALWEHFEKTGRLPVAVLKMLWGKHPNDKFLDHIHVLVAAMERLGLLVEPLPKDKNDKVDFYIVPSMLKKAGGTDIDAMQHILNESKTVRSCTLCVQFQKRFIPQAIWDKFTAACIHRFQPFAVPDMRSFRQCYRGSVALAIDRVWNLMIHCSGNVMKLTLFSMKADGPVATGAGHAFRLVLEDVLKQTLTMNQQSHLKFDYYLHCDPIVGQDDVTVEAGRLLRTSPLDCVQTTVDGPVAVSIERDHYDVWFQNISKEPVRVSDVGLHRRPTCKELGRIPKFLYGAHHMFFIELGLLDREIGQVRDTCGHLSFRSQMTKVFLYWCNPRPDADLHQIALAMDEHGLDSQSMLEEIEHVDDDVILKVSFVRRLLAAKEKDKENKTMCSGRVSIFCYINDTRHFNLGSEIPEQHLNRAPQPDQVGIIARFVDMSYFSLFLELDLQPHDISQCEIDHKDFGLKTVVIELLNRWIKEFGEKATLKRILVAMKECNMAVYDLSTQLSIG